MNIKFLILVLTMSVFQLSCDSDSSSDVIITDPPIGERPVVLKPITADDVPDLKLLYVGLTTEQAEAVAEDQEHLFRVVSIDGKGLAVTADFANGRINARVERGRVVSIDVELFF